MRAHEVLVAACLLAAGCSASTATTHGTNGAAGSGGAAATGTKCSPVGQQAQCYCHDGKPTGTQTCNADGSFTVCDCQAGGGAAGSGTAGTAGTKPPMPIAGPVCPKLAEQANCKPQTYQSEKLPASVLFVVDRSGSMACNPPPLQDSAACEVAFAPVDSTKPSKWQVTTDALKQVFDNLVAQKSTASVGLSFFSNDNVCGVQSMPAVGVNPLSVPQVSSLKASLDLTTPSGGTPMVGGMVLSYAYLHQEATMAPGCTPPCGAHGNRYVVVLTDGADSCGMPDPNKPETKPDAANCTKAGSCTNYLVQTAAPDALKANIKTYVIGAPGSEPARGYLSALAYAGGTAKNATCNHDPTSAAGDCHFDMATSKDFAADLTAALANISGAALGCDFAVPQTQDKVDKDHVNVQYSQGGKGTPTCFAYDNKACGGGADGWQFAKKSDGTDDLTHVVVCGKSCDTIRADVAAKVDIVLGCQPVF